EERRLAGGEQPNIEAGTVYLYSIRRRIIFPPIVGAAALTKDGKSEITFIRGARSFIQGRFESVAREAFDDGWTPEGEDERPLQTQVTIERARTILSHNDSPDVGFSTS